jgi:GTP cyclohydrolase III
MFKYWKEMRELKRTERQLKVVLLGKLYDVVQMFEGGTDILELANKMKDVDQKDIIEELVKNVTNKEKVE